MRRLSLSLALIVAIGTMAVAAELPLTRAVLFSSGVGYFEREGAVEGEATVELSFRTAQINDILKSMVLMDYDGGTIAPVTYAPQDPLERTLSSFAIDLSDNPRLSELWDRMRGAKVKVTADRTYEGIVFGSEKQEKSVGDEVMEIEVLNLMTDAGLVEVALWHVNSIELKDPKLDTDLRKALEAINKARDTNKRPVVLQFKGEGERKVSVGYLLETPIWKTSYRLVSDDEGLFLQGWAIVENTTDDDWDEIALSMVSGRPVSFIQDLYEPLYVQRPVIEPSVQAAARPQIWEGAMEEAEEMAAPREAPAPTAKLARRAGRAKGGMAAGMAMAAGYGERKMDLAETGAAAMATGGKIGTLFQYAINQPVTIPRQRSAMIPIINAGVEGEKVSVYNQRVDAKSPMNGLKMKNSSGLHLMGGPITVFADGVYGGDALIEDVAPDEERLLTYAMDLSVEVDPKTKSHPEEFLSARLVRGIMTITRKSRVEMTYTVKNKADEKRLVLVEHPLKPDWKLITPEKADEKTRSVYRFRVPVEPGETQTLTVIEDRPRPEIVRIMDRGPDEVKILLQMPELSQKIKDALRKLMEMQGEMAALDDQREEKETRIKEIEGEQDRIRKNMRELDRNSALYRQYVEKFTKQETEFEGLREEVKGLREQLDAKVKAVQDYILSIDVK